VAVVEESALVVYAVSPVTLDGHRYAEGWAKKQDNVFLNMALAWHNAAVAYVSGSFWRSDAVAKVAGGSADGCLERKRAAVACGRLNMRTR